MIHHRCEPGVVGHFFFVYFPGNFPYTKWVANLEMRTPGHQIFGLCRFFRKPPLVHITMVKLCIPNLETYQIQRAFDG